MRTAALQEPTSASYLFDDVVVDCHDFSVVKGRQKKALTPRAFDVLRYLIEHRDHVVEKSELFEQVWKEKFVTDNALTRTVTEIRHVLGDSADSPHYIETVPKRGYRFIAEVNCLAEQEVAHTEGLGPPLIEVAEEQPAVGGAAAAPQVVSTRRRLGAVSRHKLASVLVVSVLTLGGIGAYLLTGRGKAIDSVAVMPFTNGSGDPQAEYLSDGIAESLINNLSQLPNLQVTARTTVFRYKGREIDPQKVGRELGVRTVLTGRVAERADVLIIQADLVSVADGSQLWGAQYNRKPADIFAVQEEISRKIAETLRLRLSGEEQLQLTKRYTENTEAYRCYLKGRHILDKRTPEAAVKSIEYFEQATRLDPNYALAYADLALAYFSLAGLGARSPKEVIPKAKEAVTKALEIDDRLAEAHTSLGYIRYGHDWDWSGAEREFKRAIELNPNSARVHQGYAHYLYTVGRFDEAIAEIKRALELEPVSVHINRDVALVLYFARQYDQAIEQCQKTLELDPNFSTAYVWLAKAYEQKGLHEQAIEAFLFRHNPETKAALREAYAVSGWRGYWQKELDWEKSQSMQRYIRPHRLAEFYARLGEKDQAFAWLEKTYEERSLAITTLKVEPLWDNLRSDPRFQELQRRVGFPQ
jgi:TolB-like protein/DNA-binding winged helix-turn-helix (wHTH) protein